MFENKKLVVIPFCRETARELGIAQINNLAKHLDIIFDAYGRLAQNVRSIIRKTVLEMVLGMKETVIRHSSQKNISTDSEDDFDRYCYYVAGTVGHMLTDLFREFSRGSIINSIL